MNIPFEKKYVFIRLTRNLDRSFNTFWWKQMQITVLLSGLFLDIFLAV